MKIAAQLYSLRKAMEKDLDATLKAVKEMGYDYVQLDGLRGNDIYDVARTLEKYDLKVIGMHIKHDRFKDDLDGIIFECMLFNCKLVYDKYIEDEDQNDRGYRETKSMLLDAVRILSPLGIRVGLHCPEYDYNNEIDGRIVLDYITDPVDGMCVYAEPDTYWMSVAGKDPVEEIKRYSGRMPIIHCKDIISGIDVNDIENNLTECGKGSVDFKSVIEYGKRNGVEFMVIEQDLSKQDMFTSMKESLDYLEGLMSS